MSWLVDDARDWWKWASTWASGTGVGVLVVWNMMPPSIRYMLPDWVLVPVGIGLWSLCLAARIWKQPKKARTDA